MTTAGVPSDTQKPTIELLAPAAGSTQSGVITVSASAGDNVGVTNVRFFRDGPDAAVELAPDATGLGGVYSSTLDTTTLPDGAHTAAAIAYDAAGNSKGTAWISFTVSNNQTPPSGDSPIVDAGSLPVGQASYAVPSGAVFVATTGSDTTGTGSQSSPYATLAKAVSAAADGSTIVLRAGSYNEGEDTQDQAYPMGIVIGKNVTIQNYPGEAVWFDGSLPVTTSWTQSGSTWSTAYDRIFDRSPTFTHGQADGTGADTGAGGWFLTDDNPQAAWPDMILYDGAQLTQVQTLAEVGPGKFFVEGHTGNDAYWFVGTKLYIGDNPSGHEVRYANKTKLMTPAGFTYATTLRGVGIRRYATFSCGWGVIYNQHKLTLENVWFEDLSTNAGVLAGCTGSTLRKVTARRIGGNNFFTSNESRNVTLDRLDLQQVNYGGWNMYGPTNGAIKVSKIQNITLKNSIISNNNGTGFWTDQTVATPIVVNCIFENNANRAVDFETSSDSVLANCKVIHNGTVSVFVNDSDTTRMYNNTFAENSWNFASKEGSKGAANSTTCPLIQLGQSPRRYDVSLYSYCIDPKLPNSYYTDTPSHQWTINSFELVNNVMARAGVNTYAMMICGNDNDSTRDPNRVFQPDFHPVMDGNVYHWGSNQPKYPWATAGGYQKNYGVYFSLAAFQAGTSPTLDAHSTFASSDPLDANYQLIDTTLHSNATGLPADIATLIGQPAGTKHIGCFW